MRAPRTVVSVMVGTVVSTLLLVPTHPVTGQIKGVPLVPRAWESWCWRNRPCQDASHIAIHLGISCALAALPDVSPRTAFHIALAQIAVQETVGLFRHLDACGSIGCNEPVFGDFDPVVDLATRSFGAWLGWRIAESWWGKKAPAVQPYLYPEVGGGCGVAVAWRIP